MPNKNSSQRRRLFKCVRTKRSMAGRPMRRSVISHSPAAITTMRSANTSVPLIGCIQWLNRYSTLNSSCDSRHNTTPLLKSDTNTPGDEYRKS